MVRVSKNKLIIEISTREEPLVELSEYKEALLHALTMMDIEVHGEYKNQCVQKIAYLLSSMEFSEKQICAIDTALHHYDKQIQEKLKEEFFIGG